MDIQFGLTTLAIGRFPFLEISKENFEQLKTSRRLSWKALVLEEAFDLLIENYIELEQELLSRALRHMAFRMAFDWSSGTADLYALNRRLVNVLSTSKMYLDHAKNEAKEYNVPGYDKNSVAIIANGEHTKNFAYRVMDCLRNHSLHAGMPIHGIVYPSNRPTSPTQEGSQIEARIVPYTDVEKLASNPAFKKNVLEEIRQKGQKLAIVPLARSYTESMARIHQEIRSQLKEEVSRADTDIFQAVEMYKALNAETGTIGLGIVARHGNKNVESYQLFVDGITRRSFLERKNSLLEYLSVHYVSGIASEEVVK